MSAVLVDTCAVIFIVNGTPIAQTAREALKRAALGDGIIVSVVTAWEIGLLASKKGLTFQPDPEKWFQRVLDYPGFRLIPITPEIAIRSSFLPQGEGGLPIHNDPADRLLIATARALDVPIVTRDRPILAYARSGSVKALAC